MDLFKKMFSSKQPADENKENRKQPAAESDEFRKPIWYDDKETDGDDDLFGNNKTVGFQVFTNPIELQKHFEHQLNEMMKTIEGEDETMQIFDRNFREEYLKPGYEDNIMSEIEPKSKLLDTDLDGEIYADQLHTLLQRVSPEIKAMIPATIKKSETKIKRTEDETIMDRIHGTQLKEDEPPRRRQITKTPHNGAGAFEGAFQGPKIFGQSIISQSIRKPDGTLETRRVVRDSEGNTKTTLTRTVNGKTETTTSIENGGNLKKIVEPRGFETGFNILNLDRNMFVTKAGYTLPKNLW